MTRKIFISHKNTDATLAAKVARRVHINGKQTYLDVIDDALIKDGPDLADLLLQRMSTCDELIAVVSNSTKDSWWVPWEIGVGSEKGFRMASFSESNVNLPSYLEKWPELHTDTDIDLYCKYSDRADAEIQQRYRYVFSDANRLQVRKSKAGDFHKTLRAELRRQRW